MQPHSIATLRRPPANKVVIIRMHAFTPLLLLPGLQVDMEGGDKKSMRVRKVRWRLQWSWGLHL